MAGTRADRTVRTPADEEAATAQQVEVVPADEAEAVIDAEMTRWSALLDRLK